MTEERPVNAQDETAATNEQWWEQMVSEGCGFTRPWLDLDRRRIVAYSQGTLSVPGSPDDPLSNMFPPGVLVGVEGKDVLCLASGGGQQSAVFGLLGARVTVVDLAEGQLEGDRQAAAHYGYDVRTIRADMRDLSCIADASFDLVYQAPSMAYVPDVREVYAGVARVLRAGGRYRVALTNPAAQFVDADSWDGQGYRITVPYAVRHVEGTGEGAAEFRHYLSDLFNGLIDAGFSIRHVQEAPYHLQHDPTACPGSWEHILAHIPWIFAVVSVKAQGHR
jgi:ubiquinone/menaquinone biosynthesis C-methylase UbiE